MFLLDTPLQEGYRLYDLASGEIHVSRDVIFLEDEYPFKQGDMGQDEIVQTQAPIDEVVDDVDSIQENLEQLQHATGEVFQPTEVVEPSHEVTEQGESEVPTR